MENFREFAEAKYKKNEIADMMKAFLESRDKVAIEILRGMDENVRISKGMGKFLKRIEDDKDNELTLSNLKYMLKVTLKYTAMAEMNNVQVMAAMLAYVMSDSFPSDSANVLVRMGKGEEALRTLFKQKFGGILDKER